MKEFKTFLVKTMNGMTQGLFVTLIIGVIIQQIGKLIGVGLIEKTLANTLIQLMGAGIGVGIAMSMKLEGLKLVLSAIIGSIATMVSPVLMESTSSVNNNPVLVYIVVVFTLLIMNQVLKKKTPVDIILIPLLGVALAFGLTYALYIPINFIIDQIGLGVKAAVELQPFLMSIIISVVMGIILTSPVSSAAIAISINLSGIAAAAAVVGTTVQMLGFAVQSIRKNKIGTVISIAIGTSMLQFKNIIKKPMIWLPTIITSALIAPIFTIGFDMISTKEGAGMGTSGLVGFLQTLEAMQYTTKAFLALGTLLIVAPLVTGLIHELFRKKQWISDDDLIVEL